MRVIVTGQIGVDKKPYLGAVEQLIGERGEAISVHHVGDRMYAEGTDVRAGKILDLPLSRLHSLRRSVMKDIIAESAGQENVIVNTHATFRWRHGLFRAFDFDQITQFKPDALVCLVDNAETVYHRLHQDHVIDATLKDIMVWREEEIMATEMLAQAVGCGNRFYVLSRGREKPTTETCARLVCRPGMKKVYPSFPMTHVVNMPEVMKEINDFRERLAKYFVTFDPGDVDEKLLLDAAIAAVREGQVFLESQATNDAGKRETFRVPVQQVLECAGDIDGQIYARDFKLIDQSDMIVSLVPELEGGLPGLSSGVERELQHAFEGSKDVYVVWKPGRNPSPFITETATKVFGTVDEAMKYFEEKGMVVRTSLFGH